jgi:cytochrome b6-f complex iron-sulfur subunit
VPTNDRFECPCHGSKYLANGVRVDGPATRNLDVFIVEALDASGKVLAKTESGDPSVDSKAGAPFLLPQGTVQIRIDTGKKIQGAFNTKPGGGK